MVIEHASGYTPEDDSAPVSLERMIESADRWGALAEKDLLMVPILDGRIRISDLFQYDARFRRGRRRLGLSI